MLQVSMADHTAQERFQLGQPVEVLQRSKDLRGSWQLATIVLVRNGRREVEYMEVLQKDGVQKLRESFSIIKNSDAWCKKFGTKIIGFLRPISPQLTSNELKTWSKGQFVDAFMEGAWWEGVLQEDINTDECEFAKVLFPDRNHECTLHVESLRVSHEWDELSGLWEVRGYWKGLSPGGKDTSWREANNIGKLSGCNGYSVHCESKSLPPRQSQKEDRDERFKALVFQKRNEARDFLLSMGYKIEYHQRIGRSREAVYIAPGGRRFYSLTMACKAWRKKHMPCTVGACDSKCEKLLAIYDIMGAPFHGRLDVNTGDVFDPESPTRERSIHPEKKFRHKPKLCLEEVIEGESNRLRRKRKQSKEKNGHALLLLEAPCTTGQCRSKQASKLSKRKTVSTLQSSGNAGHMAPSRTVFLPLLTGSYSKEASDGCPKNPSENDLRESCSPASTVTEATKALVISPRPSSSSKESIGQVMRDAEVDDICSVCGDGGELILCDNCPSTFHSDCVGLHAIPEGNWYCSGCCCASCGGFLYDIETRTMPFTCSQCDNKYHSSCVPMEARHESANVGEKCWFCGFSCREVYAGLQRRIGLSWPLDVGGLSCMLLKFDQQQDSCGAPISSKGQLAHAVLRECFVPMIDKCTGVDIISQVLFSCGSRMLRLDCRGFYTLILERGCEMISVATFRVHGSRLAEMPFIGTRFRDRYKGMCRRLISLLENMLQEVGVEKLVLPAIPELLKTWRSKFSFQHINSRDRMDLMRVIIMRFPGTTLMKKYLANTSRLASSQRSMYCEALQLHRKGNWPLHMAGAKQPAVGDLPSLAIEQEPIGGRDILKRSRKPKRSSGNVELDSADAKIIIATTKFNRMVKASQWYADSMKELSNYAKFSRNKKNHRVPVPLKRQPKAKKRKASSSQCGSGPTVSIIPIDKGNCFQFGETIKDSVDSIMSTMDYDQSPIDVQGLLTCAKFYTRRNRQFEHPPLARERLDATY